MEITVHLPDDLAQRPNPGREALESLAIEGYRTGALTHFQASQMLGLSRIEFDGFLKERQVTEHAYGVDQLNRDWQSVQADIERRVKLYSQWLRECADAKCLSIEHTSDNGPFPYQWKISMADSLKFVDYVTLDGPVLAASDAEKKDFLCSQLLEKVKKARGTGRIS
jgi:predicted HTH domain antitoxin